MKLNRIINDPDLVVEDAIEGYVAAHPELFAKTDHERVLKYPAIPQKGKVGIVTGGGSGHEPAFLGYVGKNMVDAVAIGEIFSSPTAGAFLDAMKASDGGAGVACLYGNYAGDNMNVKMAVKKAAAAGITVKTVVANDDVASAPITEREKRRGVAGEILMWKVGGAAAAAGYDLDGVIAAAQKAIDNCRSIGVGLSSCIIPAVGHPNFNIDNGMMEVGIGHHGEPGINVVPLQPAKEMAHTMLEPILKEGIFEAGSEVVVLVSGLGATPTMELYIYYAEVDRILKEKGVKVHRSYVGNYFTSLEMMGVTLSMMKLDDELKKLVDAPVHSLGMVQG
ncbi:dihydroxyacetone kinase subunit DhaK [Commensalibacter papalotli (ex Servin-Garciduenas et al. 2014)]|uniref:Dak kinase n=1 Tax=Commensalibacter papalotli (ex Servin-Garciduenas et al. 2014) TaxID=1208583 RepID=W7DUU9_9PROT|nr:dihydroxyacetone kinase subunit DhaK [Commensalibacter papalotli (ex Servin-Garciduenas et al. 2014)]EUK18038.1 Dak kinase [Commensalibacter papalotli (ex Servin-Garciduenas et al. 2014)]